MAAAPFCDLLHVRPRKALVLSRRSLQPNSEALQAGEALRLALCLHGLLYAPWSHRLIRHLLSAQQMGGSCFSTGQTENENRLKILLTEAVLRRSGRAEEEQMSCRQEG